MPDRPVWTADAATLTAQMVGLLDGVGYSTLHPHKMAPPRPVDEAVIVFTNGDRVERMPLDPAQPLPLRYMACLVAAVRAGRDDLVQTLVESMLGALPAAAVPPVLAAALKFAAEVERDFFAQARANGSDPPTVEIRHFPPRARAPEEGAP